MMTWQLELSWQLGIALGIAALFGILIAYLLTRIHYERRLRVTAVLENELQTTLQVERERHTQKIAAMEEARVQLRESFASLSQQALRTNNDAFLQLATQQLGQFQERANANLSEKENAIKTLLKPVSEALQKTEKQIIEIEKERKQSFGSITEQLKNLAETQQSLRSETGNLVQALRRPEVRGQWGELTLKRMAELAGMVEHCDFYEQEHQRIDEGNNIRPDMIVRMPERRELIVDAKTPLDAYLSAVQCSDGQERDTHLRRHARKVRERMKELASKAYWSQFEQSPDFVILFIPGEQFLTSALEYDEKLLEDAFANQVILATPTTLVALLRAVAYGWQQVAMSENTEKVRALAQDLYKRLNTFAEHMQRVGKSLDNSIEHYNKAVGSLERNVLPGARKFTEMGIPTKNEVPTLEPIEKKARSLDE